MIGNRGTWLWSVHMYSGPFAPTAFSSTVKSFSYTILFQLRNMTSVNPPLSATGSLMTGTQFLGNPDVDPTKPSASGNGTFISLTEPLGKHTKEATEASDASDDEFAAPKQDPETLTAQSTKIQTPEALPTEDKDDESHEA
jgi:hypothetical protein